MKPQDFRVSFIFVLLLCTSLTSSRLLTPKRGEKGTLKVEGISTNAAGSLIDLEDISNLMGLEECDDKDEGCLHGRMIAEAHLDYIYTQHRKP
ncbi:putative phytosulfokines 6 [Juglans microcarpa x Juglans regia]|uniref:putative phytosulfokines 6 n=1 Tax=Juglans microcarpa x Juglans regia TaxID=2249226 RepID=UPI001B7EA7E5|nr:putative phytosulfokines 6 [Juglans microcarpa x Juglans regia]